MGDLQRELDRLQQHVIHLRQTSRFREAVNTAARICELTRQRSGEGHLDYAASLNNLAELQQELADYAAAERLYSQALAISEAAPERDRRLASGILGNLGQLYHAIGRFDAAEPLLRRALEVARDACGETGRELATALNALARFHEATGQFPQAEPLFREALEVLQRSVPGDDPDLATALNNLGALHASMGRFRDAKPLLEQGLAIRRQVLGHYHDDTAQSLSNLAAVHKALGDFRCAKLGLREALKIRQKLHGSHNPALATTLDNLASVLRITADYKEAKQLFQRALQIRRAVLLPDHPDVALSLSNLAGLHVAVADYSAAIPLYEQALLLRRQRLGDHHPDVANTLSGLSVAYNALGDYKAAEPLLIEALSIRRRTLDADHPDVATSLDNLAALYREKGAFDLADPLFREALEIRRRVLGDQHPETAISMNNLSALYRAMGDYVLAEGHALGALEINRKVLGGEHPRTVTGMHNLAGLYRAMGRGVAAEPLYRQALEITGRTLGKRHPHFVQSLNSLAALHYSRHNFVEALPLFEEARAIRRNILGSDHPFVANTLNNLALTRCAIGDNAAAEPLLREAIRIWKRSLGADHPDLATGIANLARVLAALDRPREALRQIGRLVAVLDRVIGRVFSVSSERRRMAYLATIRRALDLSISLILLDHPIQPELAALGLDLVFRRKGLGAEALATQRDAILGGRHLDLVEALRAWTLLRQQIASKALAGPGRGSIEMHRQELAEWEARREELEARLARKIPEMNMARRFDAADRRAIAGALPAKSVLVEFFRYEMFNFAAVPARGDASWGPAHYLAFILQAGKPETVNVVELGPSAPIDQMVGRLRSAITGENDSARARGEQQTVAQKNDKVIVRHARPLNDAATSTVAEVGRTVCAAVFEPILPYLVGTRLFLAPDGDLARLPFEVLPIRGNRCVIDDYRISYLAVGRDAVHFDIPCFTQPADPLVLADPDFDLTAAGAPAETSPEPERRSRDFRGAHLWFGELPGTRTEGNEVSRLLGVSPLLGTFALEGRLKASRSPRILHLASHGFFLPDQAGGSTAKADEADGLSGVDRLLRLEDPLLRSGLALAGANTWLAGGMLPAEAEDGILTAEDVVGLDLVDTELVILSACETGLGQIQIGEGVFGLRRAFVLAGAKTLVMSLWKVPDQATQELMVDFYRRILRGETRAAALREAQLSTRKKYPHPLFWAAFICQGDPGPLLSQPPSLRSLLLDIQTDRSEASAT
jgi:tetratricopeptide (TPR) repeat protein